MVWMIAAAEGWIKLSYNLMHGKEYGDSKWGDIFDSMINTPRLLHFFSNRDLCSRSN